MTEEYQVSVLERGHSLLGFLCAMVGVFLLFFNSYFGFLHGHPVVQGLLRERNKAEEVFKEINSLLFSTLQKSSPQSQM